MYIEYIYQELIHELLTKEFPKRVSCYNLKDEAFLSCFRDDVFSYFSYDNEGKLETIFDFLIRDYQSMIEAKELKLNREQNYRMYHVFKGDFDSDLTYPEYIKKSKVQIKETDEYKALYWLKIKKCSKHFSFQRFLVLLIYAYEWRFECSYLTKYPSDIEILLKKCFTLSSETIKDITYTYSGVLQDVLISIISNNIKKSIQNTSKFTLGRSLL